MDGIDGVDCVEGCGVADGLLIWVDESACNVVVALLVVGDCGQPVVSPRRPRLEDVVLRGDVRLLADEDPTTARRMCGCCLARF